MRTAASVLMALLVAACGDAKVPDRLVLSTPGADGPSIEVARLDAVRTARRAARPRVDSEDAPCDTEADEASGTEHEPVEGPLPPGTWIMGRVVDENGAPIADARVVAFLGVQTAENRTSSTGKFTIGVENPTGVARCVAWGKGRAVAVSAWFPLRQWDAVEADTLRCGPAAPIEGRIVGPDGTNAYGRVSVDETDAFDTETWALVRRCASLDGIDVPYACSGVGGFEISCLPPGRYRLHVEEGGENVTVTAPAADVRLASPPSSRTRTRSIEVRVAEVGGTIVNDFTATARSLDVGSPLESRWSSDRRDGGTLRVTGDADGDLAVDVVSADGRRASVDVRESSRACVDVVLPPQQGLGRTLRGSVCFDGKPVAWGETYHGGTRSGWSYGGQRLRVGVLSADGSGETRYVDTATDGSFAIEGLDDGAHRLWVRACPEPPWEADSDDPTHAPAVVVVNSGRSDVLVELPPARSRRFRLVLPGEKDRVDDYEATIAGPQGPLDTADAKLEIDVVTAVGLRPGVEYALSLRVRSGAVWSRTMHVEFTAGDEPIAVKIAPGLRITGEVVHGDGTPVVGAYVYAEGPNDGTADVYSGLEGTFALTGLDSGSWNVVVTAPGLEAATDRIAVAAGVENLRVAMTSAR